MLLVSPRTPGRRCSVKLTPIRHEGARSLHLGDSHAAAVRTPPTAGIAGAAAGSRITPGPEGGAIVGGAIRRPVPRSRCGTDRFRRRRHAAPSVRLTADLVS